MKLKYIFTSIALLLFLIVFILYKQQTLVTSKGYDIILIAGQSNATGTGCCIIESDLETHSNIKQLGRGDKDLQVIPAKEPLHSFAYQAAKQANLSGFGLTFAKLYQKYILKSERKILIINSALGGSGFLGKLNWQAPNGTLYQDAIRRVKYALQLNKDENYHNKVAVILWHQGESDAMSNNVNYLQDLSKMIHSMRQDLGDTDQTIPFLLGQLVPAWQETEGAVHKQDILKAISQVTRELPNTYEVSTANLKSNREMGINDPIHFSGPSLKILGRRYFNTFVKAKK